MINPAELVDALVEKLRAIPELVLEMEGDPPTAYYRLFDLIVNGVPAGGALKMLYTTVHPHCHPMDLPSIQRATDEQGTDYFEVMMSFTEMGD